MKKVVFSGIVGNALEWYDFAIYAHFSVIISRMFFPATDPYVASLAAWGVFAAGFLMRPIGAVVFGSIGDRYGRKAALIISILTMAIPTACIGLLPTYQQIGIWAPIALTLIRLLQGLSLGGAFSGSIAFVVEHAPNDRKCLAGSTTMFSMCVGILLGSAVASVLYFVFDTKVVEAWAWRLPFLLGLGIGLVGFYIRDHVDESPSYAQAKLEDELEEHPLRSLLKYNWRGLITGVCLYLTVTVPFYSLVFFLKEYLHLYEDFTYQEAAHISTVTIIVMTLLLPFSGALADRFGKKNVLLFASMAFVVSIYGIFQLFGLGYNNALLGALFFAILVALYMGPMPAMLVELFPIRVRYTGVALSYNLSAAFFGGTAPMVFTYLIKKTNYPQLIAFYIILFALISSLTLIKLSISRISSEEII